MGKKLDDVPVEYVQWIKTNNDLMRDVVLCAAIAEWEKIPRVYKLSFGMHQGLSLDQVPPAYIEYLHESNAAEGRDDLRQALAEHKLANAKVQRKKAASKSFDVPSDITTDLKRYYYHGTKNGGQMWIGVHDCVRFFGADGKAMQAAGLRSHFRGQRFWLHQVFAYAKHFGTTKRETPTKALNRFKARKYN
jgi:hypothetical protein